MIFACASRCLQNLFVQGLLGVMRLARNRWMLKPESLAVQERCITCGLKAVRATCDLQPREHDVEMRCHAMQSVTLHERSP